MAFPAPNHNHSRCAREALQTAEDVCRARGVRFTELRRSVLEILWESHAPLGAYDILERLNAGGGRNAPMAVYRALDFLMDVGLVHKLSSLNAFVGCAEPEADHAAQFLICTECGTVAELDATPILSALDRAAEAEGFAVNKPLIEVSGACPNCRTSASTPT